MDKADAAFSSRFPDRTTRMRLASRDERERITASLPSHAPPKPAGWAWFTLVQRGALGMHVRQYLMAPADTDCDLSEKEARAKWDEFPLPNSAETLRAAIGLAQVGGEWVTLHLPVGVGSKAYPNVATAAVTVNDLAAALGLPAAATIRSATGLFAILPFPNAEPATRLFWRAIAETAVRMFGLHADSVTVGDAAAALATVQEAIK